jgi:hypothetical protein
MTNRNEPTPFALQGSIMPGFMSMADFKSIGAKSPLPRLAAAFGEKPDGSLP